MRFLTSSVLAATCVATALAAQGPEPGPRAAIERAIVERMGDGARVTLEDLQVRATDDVSKVALRAVPPPAGRTGQRVAFALFDGARRVGTATTTVRVALTHVRAAVQVARDAVVAAGDTSVSVGVVDGLRFERVPGPAELVGARVRRTIAPGEPLTHATVIVAEAVRSGDDVEVVARIGSVEARGTGRASGSGHVGDWVRVSSPGQRTLQSARIVAPGVVELHPHRRVPSNGTPGDKR